MCVLSLCAQDVYMVIRIWPQHPLRGLYGVHPPSNPHLCHSQTTGAKNHHCWENGENHGGTGWHVLNVFNPVWILTPDNSFYCLDEGCLLLPLLPWGVAHGVWRSQPGSALFLRPSPRSHLPAGFLPAVPAHLWTDSCGGDGWYVHHTGELFVPD